LAANGVQESRMAKAKELIAAKNYNDAILILTQVVREEPERQDEAQELISEIVKLRNQYNNDYQDLIKLLYQEKDVDSALQAIARLEAIDKNPNKQTKDEISQAKRTARLIANNKHYRDIMSRGLALLEQHQYAAAIQVYLEGSTLARDMFDEADYGNIVANQVDQSWADLKAAAAQFAPLEARFKALPAQGTNILAGGTGSLEAQLAAIRDLAAWRRRAVTDGRLFRNQNDFLTKNGRQEDFFLGYSYLFVHGPPDAKAPEGISGAFDRLWSDILTPWTDQIKKTVEARYDTAKALVDQGKLAEAGQAFEALRAAARQGLDVAAAWNQMAEIGPGALDDEVLSIINRGLPLGLWMEHRLTLALQGLQASSGPGVAVAPQNTDRPAIESARAEAKRLKDIYGGFSDDDGHWAAQTSALSAEGFALLDPVSFGNSWQTEWAGYRQRYRDSEAGLVDRRGQLDYGTLDGRFQAMQATMTEIRDQVEGKTRYPLQATGRLNEIKPAQETLFRDVSAFVALYDGESPDVKTPAVLRWPVRGRELLGQLNDAQTLRGQLAATAQVNYLQSVAAKKQGQDEVPRIASLITAENFNQARTVLNDISTKYSQSLALQEDAAFRTDSDAQIKSLFDSILKAENTVVVRDVRALITKGSQAYLDQEFNPAEQTLLTARARWATTNTDPNPEVEYWLTLANYALSVTTGRELSPIDPLYNEVQQLLNFARRQFTLAQEKLAAGQKTEGADLMRQAKETLTKILIPFPLNQEARLLNLAILKASDPDNFPALFKQNFDAAVAKLDRDTNVAYNDLQDLDKIQPNNPEILAAIKTARIKLGLERAPIDPAVQARARTLTAQAQRLFDTGNVTQLANAQGLVRQALTADPTNAAASELFDKISLLLRSQVQTLNVTQRGEITEIQDLFLGQKTLEALSRITEFEAKYPGIVNINEVKELDRRIRAVN
jgi:hypothetical protein